MNRRPEMIPPLFHTVSPIQPPPLRGTSFHRKEGASTRAPSYGRGCRAQRGGVGFLFGRRSGALVSDALETISPLFFIPPEPYPARFARHLPHAGKAVIRKSRFPHPTSAPSGHLLPEEGGSLHASPFPWKGLPSAARRGWLPFSAAKPPPSFLIPISHSCRAFARDQGTACPTPTTKGQTNETYCYSPYDGGKNIDAAYRSFGSEAR